MTTEDRSEYIVDTESQGLRQVFTTKNAQEAEQYYNQWADTYDQELKNTYHAPKRLVEFVVKCLGPEHDRSMRILDVGAGTGLVAECLREHGYTNIDAHDGSLEMLKKAEQKGLYKNYFQELLQESSASKTLEAGAYDLVIGVGIFNAGHMNHKHLHHLINSAKPSGGRIIFGITNAAFILDEFKSYVDKKMCTEHNCSLITQEHIPNYFFGVKDKDPSATFYHILRL